MDHSDTATGRQLTTVDLALGTSQQRALALALLEAAHDAHSCFSWGRRNYTVWAAPYPYDNDLTSDEWRLYDNDDGEIAEVVWNGSAWERSYLSPIFAALMDEQEAG